MRLTTLSPFGEPRNARELIVRALAERGSLTFRQLQNAVRNLGRPMSSQGLWKHLRILMEDGQVERVAQGAYRIRLRWIKDLRTLCGIMERSHQAHQIYEEIG